MNKFLTGKELEEAIYNIIWEAERTLLIVSPFVKLDDYFKKLFQKHTLNPKLHILIVFGKNEKDVNRSLNKADFDFFKSFPNISIVYVPTLHAKYYGNENMGMITSINLYDYSFKNNIEFGVYYEHKLINSFFSSADDDAWDECMKIAQNNEVVYINRPVYKSANLGFSKNYVRSEVLYDSTDKFYGSAPAKKSTNKKLDEFPDELKLSDLTSERPTREVVEQASTTSKEPRKGYCIRTGVEIPFDLERPFCGSAYSKWQRYSNPDFPESYCHFSGEPSHGETTFSKPILRKNWNKVKGLMEV